MQIAEELLALDAQRVDIADDVACAAAVIELHLEPASVLLGGLFHLLQRLVVDHHAVAQSWAFGDERDAANDAGLRVDDAGGGCECNDGFHRQGDGRQN